MAFIGMGINVGLLYQRLRHTILNLIPRSIRCARVFQPLFNYSLRFMQSLPFTIQITDY